MPCSVSLISHTTDPVLTVAAAAKLCYSACSALEIQEKQDLLKAKEFISDNPINQLEHISFSIKKDKFVKINEVFDDVYKNGAGYYIIDIFLKNEEDASYEDDDVYEYDKNSYIVVKPGIQDFQSYEEDFLNVITYNIQELNNIFMNTNLNCESKVYTVLESINAVSNRVIDIESIPSWVIIYFINSNFVFTRIKKSYSSIILVRPISVCWLLHGKTKRFL
mgnify:CR=1 FL=1